MKRKFLMPMAALLCAGALWAAPENEINLKWNELPARVAGKKVALVLPSGVAIEGKVQSVDADRLVVDVGKTSDKHSLRKGIQFIPRSSVSLLRMTEFKHA